MENKFKKLLSNISSFLLPITGGILGAMGGAGKKSLRRIYIPLLLSGLAYVELEHIAVISIMSMCGFLSMGYGIPDPTDEGSALGRFFYKLFKSNHKLADIAVRGVIGKLIALSLISVPILKHNWLVYGLCSLGIILTNTLISWRGFGTYKLFNKELSWVETITWGLITLFATIIIKL
jgi:hypothetical protein